jgi:hypothetical protein
MCMLWKFLAVFLHYQLKLTHNVNTHTKNNLFSQAIKIFFIPYTLIPPPVCHDQKEKGK